MKEQKKLSGEALAAKIIEEFSRIEEEAEGFEFPYTVTVHGSETELGEKDVPGVEIHNDCEDPIFIPDSEGMTEDEAVAFAEGLAENFIGQRHVDTMYCVITNGTDEDDFEDFSSAAWTSEEMYRDWLIGEINRGVNMCELEKDESGKRKYQICFDGDKTIFDDGPIIEERELVWWGR